MRNAPSAEDTLINLVALVILAVGAVIGARRGSLAMALSFAAVFAGYACAWLLFRPLGGAMGRAFHLAPVFAMPIAALAVLLVVTAIVKLVAHRIASRRAAASAVGQAMSVLDRAGGAALGAAFAWIIVAVLAWAAGSASALLGRGPDIAGTLTGRLAARTIRGASALIVRRASGSPMASRLMAAMAANPGAAVAALNGVLGNPEVRRLWTDAALRKAITNGDAQALAASPAMQALAGNRAFTDGVQRLGLVTAQGDGAIDAKTLAAQLSPVMRSIESVRGNPDVQRQLADPHMRQLLESRNVPAMLADPAFNTLIGRLFSQLGRTP